MKCALHLYLTLALLAFAVCGSLGSDTAINFNFEGMIPAASGSSSDGPQHHLIRVFEVSTTDVATPGFGSEESAPLMTDVWANQLWDEDKSEVVGYDIGQCTITPAVNNEGPLYQLCHVTHFYNGGADQLVVLGATTFESVPQTVSIVGGAGAYAGAYGSCTYQPFPNYDVHYVCDFYTPN